MWAPLPPHYLYRAKWRYQVKATLLAYLLREDLNEEMYMADEAGLSLSTSISKVCASGVFVCVWVCPVHVSVP